MTKLQLGKPLRLGLKPGRRRIRANTCPYYAHDFNTPGGETRAAWKAIRKERVSTPKFIRVGVSIKSILLTDSAHATVKFRQTYKSGHLNVADNKIFLMVKADGKWLIKEERSK